MTVRWLVGFGVSLAVVAGSCSSDSDSIEGLESAADGITVSYVVPNEAPRGLTLDLHVHGSGFDEASAVTLEMDGVAVPEIRTNSTILVSSEEVVANVTISEFATPGLYDLVVASGTRKRGIGLEAFRVTAIVVGTLPGGMVSAAHAINENDEVVGLAQIGFGEDGSDPLHATYWNGGALEDLGPGMATGISSDCLPGRCRIVGSRGNRPVIWIKRDGAWSVEELPVDAAIEGLEGPWYGNAFDINRQGDRVVGNVPGPGGLTIAALWTLSPAGEWSLERLAPAAETAVAYGINDGGLIVGQVWPQAVVWGREFGAWRAHVLQPLPGDGEAVAGGVNGVGDVVGSSLSSWSRGRAVVWRRTATGWDPPIELITPDPDGPPVESTGATDINESGQIVGTIRYEELYMRLRGLMLQTQRAFLRTEKGVVIDLGIFGERGTVAYALNDRARVVGSNTDVALLWIVSPD